MRDDRLKVLVYRYASLAGIFLALFPGALLAILAYTDHSTFARALTIAGFALAWASGYLAHDRIAPSKRESTLYLEANRGATFVWFIAAAVYAARIFFDDPLPNSPVADATIYFLVGTMMGLALTTNVSLYLGTRYGVDGFLEWKVLRFPYSIGAMLKALFGRKHG